MKKFIWLITLTSLLGFKAFAQDLKRELFFEKLGVKIVFNITKGPIVLEETIGDLYLYDLKTNEKLSFPEGKKVLEVSVVSKDMDVLSPKPSVHLNYKSSDDRKLSRIFFTAGGRWEMIFNLKIKGQTESQSLIFDLENKIDFPKDVKSFPYVGKKAHELVGILGGTGCRRRWDFVDTHDSLHMNMPYDLCGKYAMVSTRYHKWVDLSIDGDKVEKLTLAPLKGDAVLESAECKSERDIYKLIHYPVCGKEGSAIAHCDKAGNPVNPQDLGCN